MPTPEQVASAASLRAAIRGSTIVRYPEDYAEAEFDLISRMNYEDAGTYQLAGCRKRFVGNTKDRRCRYCERTKPEASFRTEAHAIPESIGNQSLISNDECDRCNKLFSETFEDHFDKFTAPLRTILAVRGKTKVPSFKTRDGRSRIDCNPANLHFSISDTGPAKIVTQHERGNRFDIEMQCQPFVPLEVYRCLVKMALAIMPLPELRHFESARRWVLDRDFRPRVRVESLAMAYLYWSEDAYQNPWAMLVRRRDRSAPFPYMMFVLAMGSVLIQIALPISGRDAHLLGKRIIVPSIDPVLGFHLRDCTKMLLRLHSREKKDDFGYGFVMAYASSNVIGAEDFGKPPPLGSPGGQQQIAFEGIRTSLIVPH